MRGKKKKKTVGDDFGKTIGDQMAEYLEYWLLDCRFYFVVNLEPVKCYFKGGTNSSAMLQKSYKTDYFSR